MSDSCFLLTIMFVLLYVGNMSHIRSLVNKANQKVASQSSSSRKRDEHRGRTTDKWFLVRVSDDPEEEEVPPKRKRVAPLDKGKQVETQALVPSKDASSVGECLFQLPRVWSKQ